MRRLARAAADLQAVCLPKTTIFRMLNSLAEGGFCVWDAQTGKIHEAWPSHRGAKFRQPLTRGRDQCCQSAEIRLPIDLFDQLNEFVDR
jgi:hypothetical protein